MGCTISSSSRIYISGIGGGDGVGVIGNKHTALDRFISSQLHDVQELQLAMTDGGASGSGGIWKHIDNVEDYRHRYFSEDGEGTLGMSIPEGNMRLHGHLELRALLDEPMCIQYLRKYSISVQKQDLLLFWFEVQECRNDDSSYTRLKACERTYRKFLCGGGGGGGGMNGNSGSDKGNSGSGMLSAEDQLEMDRMIRSGSWKETLKMARTNNNNTGTGTGTGAGTHNASVVPAPAPNRGSGAAVVIQRTLELLIKAQRTCFDRLYMDLFLPFKLTPEFRLMCLALEKQYNQVSMTDFDFFEKLGEGAFGVVVSCRKRSTGEVFAMKVQRKKELLEHHDVRPHSVTDERVAHAMLVHPFIVEVSYAFQTGSLVAMAMTLCSNGDMFSLLQAMPGKQLPHEHVFFYSAEILSALTYIHQQGLIYRDLKLENILLSQDGHVKLADFGAVTYVTPPAPPTPQLPTPVIAADDDEDSEIMQVDRNGNNNNNNNNNHNYKYSDNSNSNGCSATVSTRCGGGGGTFSVIGSPSSNKQQQRDDDSAHSGAAGAGAATAAVAAEASSSGPTVITAAAVAADGSSVKAMKQSTKRGMGALAETGGAVVAPSFTAPAPVLQEQQQLLQQQLQQQLSPESGSADSYAVAGNGPSLASTHTRTHSGNNSLSPYTPDYSSVNTVSYNSPPVSKNKSAETRCAPIFAPLPEFSTTRGAPMPAVDNSVHYTPCPAESSVSEKLLNNPSLQSIGMRPRTMSVTGTVEYMSPEMMYICQKPFKACVGYTNAVDYWCLGTIMHLLYTGRFPFRAKGSNNNNNNNHHHKHPGDNPAPLPEDSDKPVDEQLHFMTTYYGPLKLDRNIFSAQTKWGDAARSIVSGLLTFDPARRLGSGLGAGYEVMAHPYFIGMCWTKLYNKALLPPSLHHSVKTSSKSILTATGLLTAQTHGHTTQSHTAGGGPSGYSSSSSHNVMLQPSSVHHQQQHQHQHQHQHHADGSDNSDSISHSNGRRSSTSTPGVIMEEDEEEGGGPRCVGGITSGCTGGAGAGQQPMNSGLKRLWCKLTGGVNTSTCTTDQENARVASGGRRGSNQLNVRASQSQMVQGGSQAQGQGRSSRHMQNQNSLEQVLMRGGMLRTWIHNGSVCSSDDFKFFRQWNYVSPRAITAERERRSSPFVLHSSGNSSSSMI